MNYSKATPNEKTNALRLWNGKTELPFKEHTNPLAKMKAIGDAVFKAIDVYCGIRAGLLSADLVKEVSKEIANKYSHMTPRDIDFAFERFFVEGGNNSWKNITKPQVLAPIVHWNNKRIEILTEFEKERREHFAKQEEQRKIIAFENESKELYAQCLKTGEWIGSVYNANVIASKYLVPLLNKSVVEKLKQQAKHEHEEHERKKEQALRRREQFFGIGITEGRRFAELVVKEAIKQQIKIK